jgi:negative regulator of flagellin synthesis FlgM
MDIRNSLDGLKSLLGVTEPSVAQAQTKSPPSTTTTALNNDHATVSSAGSEVASALADTGVRADKVAAVQAAVAAGTYSVPANAVASKLVDAMLGGDLQR